MSKKKIIVCLLLISSLSAGFYVFNKKIKLKNERITKQEYNKRLNALEGDYNRVMTVNYYSENKRESLEELKKSLYELKRKSVHEKN